MSIYRGAGGAGDAVADSSSEALLIRALVVEAEVDAAAASSSATAAAASASAAATSETNAAASAASVNVSLFVQKANNLSDLTSASTARTNLSLGTIATQAASAVAITGGTVTGITDLAVADGGTGASTTANARTNLGAAASGTNSDITALTGLTTPLTVAQGGTGATTLTANNVLLGNGTSTPQVVAPSTSGNVLTSNGSTWVSSTPTSSNPLTSGTAVASTSGTSIDFTSIPSWVKRITVMFSGVSTNGTSLPQIQLGDSGGIETTGYAAGSSYVSSASVANANYTSGFVIRTDALAAVVMDGFITINLVSSSTNTWSAGGTVYTPTPSAYLALVAGGKSLSATLDRVRITTVNGTDTFDAGSINILYE